MAKQTIKGILLEADKVYDFGGGPMSFTWEALSRVADSFNAKQKSKGFDNVVLSMAGNELVCLMEDVDLECILSSEALSASHMIDLSELLE